MAWLRLAGLVGLAGHGLAGHGLAGLGMTGLDLADWDVLIASQQHGYHFLHLYQ